MSADIGVALISNGTTIAVGILTAVVAYKASVKGAKIQIEEQQKRFQEKVREQNEFAKKSIERFLIHEIIVNFAQIRNDHLDAKINLEKTFQFGFGSNFIYKEFDKIKYELIKYHSEIVDEIVSIYNMFYLIERKIDLSSFTQQEYEEFKRFYILCSNKYL